MADGMVVVRMTSPDGLREVEFHWHPTVAAQMRVYYEKKGFRVSEPEPAKRGPGRPPKSEP